MSEKLYHIYTPNPDFTGFRNGLKSRSIQFENGKTVKPVTEKEAEVLVKVFGYKAEAVPEKKPEKKDAGKDAKPEKETSPEPPSKGDKKESKSK